MTDRHLHIISFNIPYPADYGGVIDVYHKLRWLNRIGIQVHLHCFHYGRQPAPELEALCYKVFYYPRDQRLFKHLLLKPYIVSSRESRQLVERISADEYPVLFEGLHTCGCLKELSEKGKKCFYRESNIEHQYYKHLALAEKQSGRKLYHFIESVKLYWFESVLKYASAILPVSTSDADYFSKKFSGLEVAYLPSFHASDFIEVQPGRGSYILYHGNLSVPENYLAAMYLLKDVCKNEVPFVIAGKNPPKALKEAVKSFPATKLIENPSGEEMSDLIANAQVHVLYTNQPTGLKLKLLNVLYKGRFCVVNDKMLDGTGLRDVCYVENEAESMLQRIKLLMNKDFTSEDLALRKSLLKPFSNDEKTEKLIRILFE